MLHASLQVRNFPFLHVFCIVLTPSRHSQKPDTLSGTASLQDLSLIGSRGALGWQAVVALQYTQLFP